jgi:two-component system, NarL family, sensor histidine kinase DegS
MDFREANLENESIDVSQEVLDELDQSKRALNEVNLMLEQSQVELQKLTQRNTSIAGHLQQVQGQFESLPRADIRMAYNAALDAQQRLLVMRSQLEKLQTDQTYLQKLVVLLEKLKDHFSEKSPFLSGGKNTHGAATVLEMLIDAQESERQRLARQMHDGPAQALSNFIVQTEIASRYFDMDSTKAKEELNNLKSSAMSTFQKVRDFIFDLRPMMLDDLGLFPTIRRYVDSFKEQNNIEVNLAIHGQERRMAPYIEVMIFRAVQELMRNAIQHNPENPTKLQIEAQLVVDENFTKLSIADNGKGFNEDVVSDTNGIGLKLIRERVEMLGGNFNVDTAVGHGVKVTFQIPIPEIGF